MCAENTIFDPGDDNEQQRRYLSSMYIEHILVLTRFPTKVQLLTDIMP